MTEYTDFAAIDTELERLHAAQEAAEARWAPHPVTQAPPAPAVEKRTYRSRRKYALIVSVDHLLGSGAHDLRNCWRDRKRLVTYFKRSGWEVDELADYDATGDAIRAKMAAAAAWLETGDEFMRAMSCHGSVVPNFRDPSGSVEVLCMTDCIRDQEPETFLRGCISSLEDTTWLLGLPAGVLVDFINDACHSEIPAVSLAGLARDIGNPGHGLTKYLAPPVQLESPGHTVRRMAEHSREIVSIARLAPRWAVGCKTEQTSTDTPDGGAFTQELLNAYDARPTATYQDLVLASVAAIRARGILDQEPGLEGAPERLQAPPPWASRAA